MIVELGLASEAAVANALEESRFAARQPGALLVESGDLTANDLARAIAERNGFPHVDLDEFEVDDDAAQLIDRNAAMRYCALPIAFTPDGTLVVALADPLDALAVSDIAVITKTDLLPVVAAADELMARIERLPDRPRRVAPPVAAEPPDPPQSQSPGSPAAPMPTSAPAPSFAPPPAVAPDPVASPAVPDELAGEVESLRAELDRERVARAAAEREHVAERERAAETIQSLSEGADGELETLRAELERERDEAAAKLAADSAQGAGEKDELLGEIGRLKGELERERTERTELERSRDEVGDRRALDDEEERAERERLRDIERTQHAEATRALERAASEKEELRVELEEERARRTELERQQDLERVQHAQTAKALDDAGAEIERLGSRIEELGAKRDRDREARETAERRLHERQANVASAGDEIQQALEGLGDATEAARSAAARLAIDPDDSSGAT